MGFKLSDCIPTEAEMLRMGVSGVAGSSLDGPVDDNKRTFDNLVIAVMERLREGLTGFELPSGMSLVLMGAEGLEKATPDDVIVSHVEPTEPCKIWFRVSAKMEAQLSQVDTLKSLYDAISPKLPEIQEQCNQARGYADSSATSASDALIYSQDAKNAKTEALTAKGEAVDAKNEAVRAKDAVVSAVTTAGAASQVVTEAKAYVQEAVQMVSEKQTAVLAAENRVKILERSADAAKVRAETACADAETAAQSAANNQQIVQGDMVLVSGLKQETERLTGLSRGYAEKSEEFATAAQQSASDASALKTETQGIKDSALTEVESAKTGAIDLIDAERVTVVNEMNTIKADAVAAKNGAVDARNSAAATAQDMNNKTAQLTSDVAMCKNVFANYNEFFAKMISVQRDGKVYTVRFPKYEVSTIKTGEKLDDNADMVCEVSSMTEAGRDDYQDVALFRTFDVNTEVIDGKIWVTAVKGDAGYNPDEKDTFVLGSLYYEKTWTDDSYWYYSRTDSPKDGYELCAEGKNADGSPKKFCLYAKYVAGRNSENVLGSYRGKAPLRNTMNYNNCINEGVKRGAGWSFGWAADYAYIQKTFLLKYANRDWNSLLGGCFGYNFQYMVSIPETGVTRVILKKSEAVNVVIGSNVSVGNLTSADASEDRWNAWVHNICDSAEVTKIEDYDADNSAVYLKTDAVFNTTDLTIVSSIHWRSGFSDKVLGRDGIPADARSKASGLKYPSVFQGIELMVGGYEVYGNAFMDIVDGVTRDVYVCNDVTQLTTNVTTAKSRYTKCASQMTVTENNAWRYITEVNFDLINGIALNTKAGQSGSGTGTGFCDGMWFDTGTSGQREFLCFGALGSGSTGGVFYLNGNHGLSHAGWSVLGRLFYGGLQG